MSEQGNFFIGKYNYSRRVLNHRVPIDFNHGITHNPFSFIWRSSFRNLIVAKYNILINSLVRNMSIWYCGLAFVVGIGLNEYQNYRSKGHCFTNPK
jgi:hypothetical protein